MQYVKIKNVCNLHKSYQNNLYPPHTPLKIIIRIASLYNLSFKTNVYLIEEKIQWWVLPVFTSSALHNKIKNLMFYYHFFD